MRRPLLKNVVKGAPRAIFMIQMQRWHCPITFLFGFPAVRIPLLHIRIYCIQFLESSFPRKECVTSVIAESNGTRVWDTGQYLNRPSKHLSPQHPSKHSSKKCNPLNPPTVFPHSMHTFIPLLLT